MPQVESSSPEAKSPLDEPGKLLHVEETPVWLRDYLHELGYSPKALQELLVKPGVGSIYDQVELTFRIAGNDSPLALIVRLFYLGETMDRDELAGKLGEKFDLESIERFGLLEPVGGDDGKDGKDGKDGTSKIRSRLKLAPFREDFLLADFGFERGAKLPDNFVMGVGAATQTLISITPVKTVDRVLDLGTGCGVLAMIASRHAREVVGTDLSTRAIDIARANAALNGLDNVKFIQGSLFEPVEGERFDLVVANLPFVISPETSFQFRDGETSGDELCAKVVSEISRYLAPDGTAVLLLNWHHQTEEDWNVRPLEWIGDQPLNAWLFNHQTADPITYASTWLRMMGTVDESAYREAMGTWLEHYKRLKIGRLCAGALIAQNTGAKRGWTRLNTIPESKDWPGIANDVPMILEVETMLARLAPEEIMNLRPRLTKNHRLEQIVQLEDGKWNVNSMVLSKMRGFPTKGHLDAQLVQILSMCDGARSIAEVVTELQGSPDLTTELAEGVSRVFQGMMKSGLLEANGPEADEEEPE